MQHLVPCWLCLSELTMSQEITTELPTLKDMFPNTNERTIGGNNSRFDLENLQCHPTCQVVVEILKRQLCQPLLNKSSSVPEIYLHQFWYTVKISKSEKTLTCTIDHQEINFTVDTLRTVLELPLETSRNNTKFLPFPSFETIVEFFKDLGYDDYVIPILHTQGST